MASVQPMTRVNGKAAPGTKWRAFVQRKGHPTLTKVFEAYDKAEKWGIETEAKLLSGRAPAFRELAKTTLHDVWDWYMGPDPGTEAARARLASGEPPPVICERKPKQQRWERNLLKRLQKESFAQLTLDRYKEASQALRLYAHRRTHGPDAVKGQSIRREFKLIAAMYGHLLLHGGIEAVNPLREVPKPKESEVERYKLWSDEDVLRVLQACDFDADRPPRTNRDFLGWAVAILNTTGLRPVTLFATRLEWIKWGDGIDGSIVYPKEHLKNEERHDQPLDEEAYPLVEALALHMRARNCDVLFPVSQDSLATLFAEDVRAPLVKDHPHMADLCLYGLRHTWTTRTLPFFSNLPEFMKYTGRKSIKMILPYLQATGASQAAQLNARRKAIKAGTLAAIDHTRNAADLPKS